MNDSKGYNNIMRGWRGCEFRVDPGRELDLLADRATTNDAVAQIKTMARRAGVTGTRFVAKPAPASP